MILMLPCNKEIAYNYTINNNEDTVAPHHSFVACFGNAIFMLLLQTSPSPTQLWA